MGAGGQPEEYAYLRNACAEAAWRENNGLYCCADSTQDKGQEEALVEGHARNGRGYFVESASNVHGVRGACHKSGEGGQTKASARDLQPLQRCVRRLTSSACQASPIRCRRAPAGPQATHRSRKRVEAVGWIRG